MNVALVAPSPVPFQYGGVESVLESLPRAIAALTPHQVEVVKLPASEATFWDLLDGYRRFAALDLRHFDRVISLKYPAWMVRHPHHVCYLQHRARILYDTYPAALGTSVSAQAPAVTRLLRHIDEHREDGHEALPRLFELLDDLRDDAPTLSPELFAFPGPLLRHIVHHLDDVALSPRAIRRFVAISRVVARRRDYFPGGVSVDVAPTVSRLQGLHDAGSDHFLAPGRLDGLKRVDLLVRAMRLARTTRPLLIAGTGPAERSLRELAAGDDRVRFLGFVPDADLVDLYARARAVLCVAYDEDHGLVPLEAMASRKPVVTCEDSGGPLEFVTDGETGIVTPPTPETLAAAIDRLSDDGELARRLGARAHERTRHVTWEAAVHALLGDRTPQIARSAGDVWAGGSRPRITVAVPYAVYPPQSGGQERLFHLWRGVATSFDVDLVTLGHPGTRALAAEIAPGLRETRVPRTERFAAEERRLARATPHAPPAELAPAVLLQHVPDYAAFLGRSVAGASLAVASHPYCMPALRACRGDVPLVYEAHNVEAALKAQTLPTELARVARELEAEACAAARLVVACSAEDAADLVRLYGVDPGRVHVAPNGVDTAAVTPVDRATWAASRRALGIHDTRIALFVGSRHPPNVEAAEVIVGLAESLADVTFLLVGNHCEVLAGRPRPRNVALMGRVDEATLSAVLGVADVALNPMRTGSGTNVKIATYLAAGVPVVTTPLGARGYALVDGQHAVVCAPEEFGGRLGALLADDAQATRLRIEGRRLAESAYDWGAVAAGVVGMLERVLADTEQADRRRSAG